MSPILGDPRSYRKYILQITQPSQNGCAKLQYIFAVNSGSPSMAGHLNTDGVEGDPGLTAQQPELVVIVCLNKLFRE